MYTCTIYFKRCRTSQDRVEYIEAYTLSEMVEAIDSFLENEEPFSVEIEPICQVVGTYESMKGSVA